MSGHSKFANIKHKKERNDAAKGKIFTVIGRELAVAVKEGGPDPANNSKLRDVIAKAKANNMPNDTIDRGIKKAAGDAASVNYETLTYEGYGPSGVAIIVDTLTDNKNRTAANVRSAFTKGGGNVGTPGSVSYMFDKKGQIIIDKTQLTPARILTGYVVVGVLLSALGLYEPLAQWGGAGATVPLTGFGHTLAKGVREAVASDGWIGIFTGGLTAAAGGVTAAVVAGVLMAAIFRPGDKR